MLPGDYYIRGCQDQRAMDKYLNENIDVAQLVLFRMLFGFLMSAEAAGALLTGWVHESYVEPEMTFYFFGFGFLQYLLGWPMLLVYALLGILGLLVMVGWRYRWSATALAIVWSICYLNQKSHYNNHYYLMMLISWIMVFLPANIYASLDVKSGRVVERVFARAWQVWLLPALVAIVYFYAAVAKIYPDWLKAIPVSIWFTGENFESSLWSSAVAEQLRGVFHHQRTHYFFSYAGIFFDLLVIPAFLWHRTRTLALLASLVFHLMNSAIFQIGVFPYFALSFVIFFYPVQKVRAMFFRQRPVLNPSDIPVKRPGKHPLHYAAILFIIWQFLLPLRHWMIPGNVLWTEEGHRLSWRMMLRTKSSYGSFSAVNPVTMEREWVNPSDFLTRQQERGFMSKPDMIWQFAQVLKRHYQKERNWTEVQVFADIQVSVNGRPYHPFTKHDFDLASVRWKYFGHQEWLLDPPEPLW